IRGEVVLDSNGGTARVAIVIEPARPRDLEPAGSGAILSQPIDWGLRQRLERMPAPRRLAWWAGAAVAVRLVLGLAGWLSGRLGWADPRQPAALDLRGPA